MASQDRTSYSDWLREKYSDVMTTAFYDRQILLSEIERTTAALSGDEYVYHIGSARNFQVGPRAEGGVLPEVGRAGVKRISFRPAYNYGRFGLSGNLIDASMKGGAPEPALDLEMRRLIKDTRNEVKRQMYGTGSGKFTDCGTTTASATVNVTTTKGLVPGMPIVIALKSSGVIIATDGVGFVASIVGSTSFTYSSDAAGATPQTITTSSLHAVYPVGGAHSTASLARNNAIYGLTGIIDERNPSSIDSGVSNYGGVDRSVAAGFFFQGVRKHNSGVNRELSEDLMMEAWLAAESEGGGQVRLIICGNGVWRKYGNLLRQDRRFTGSYSRYKGGWDALDFNGKPIVRDPLCPPNKMFFLDTDTWEFLEETPFGFVDDDGAILRMGTGASATHVFEGLVYHAGQLACRNPKANVKLEDITE